MPDQRPEEAQQQQRPRTPWQLESFVEQRIREAMERGDFDRLETKGQPLRLDLKDAELWLVGSVHDEAKPHLKKYWRDNIKVVGFKRDVAMEMVLQTVAGSVQWARASGRHPAELRNVVTSPGGTSAAGLLALERAGVRGALIDAVEAATRRARELAQADD